MGKQTTMLVSALLAWAPTCAMAQSPSAPSAAEIQASRDALATLDFNRLASDRAYADEILRHLDRPTGAGPASLVDRTRMIALITVERREEALQVVDRIIASAPADSTFYAPPWFVALRLRDHRRAAEVIAAASRNVRADGWARLREIFDERAVWPLLTEMRRSGLSAERAATAEALYRIGWPNDRDRESVDTLRGIIVENLVSRGSYAEARQIIATIATVSALLPMLVLSKYDQALPNVDRLALLRSVVARQDQDTAEALAATPTEFRRILDRANFLRQVGRGTEAYRLIEPFTRDVGATVSADRMGMWLVNEASYILQAQGRYAESVRLMERLVRQPLAANPDLIGVLLNHANVLLNADRPADALAYAQRIERDAITYANDYGRSTLAANIVCALEQLNRVGETAPWMTRLRQNRRSAPTSLIRATICLNDLEAAERLMVEELAGDAPEQIALSLQDYQLRPANEANETMMRRFLAVRDRPAIREALNRVGRMLSLPLTP